MTKKKEFMPLAVPRWAAAQLLGSSVNRIDYLRRAGLLEGVLLEPGGEYLYRVADIERLINGEQET